MAGLDPAPGTVCQTFDGNARAADSGSWWMSTGWFTGPQAVQDPPCAPSVSIAAGGAAAQCRFSGATAIPMATTAPVDGSPITVSVAHSLGGSSLQQLYVSSLKAPGQTCDGSVWTPKVGGDTKSRWTFDMEKWRWERAGPGGIVLSGSTAKHTLAARRWGDSRDGLADAVKRVRVDLDQSHAHTAKPAEHHVRHTTTAAREGGFADVAGLTKQKDALRASVVLPLRFPRLLQRLGARACRGVLLHGPPGSGKTYLARALAVEAHAYLEVVNGPEVVAGQKAEARLRAAFKAAVANAPSVLFIDEVDAVGPSREHTQSDTERQSTARLLVLLDELAASSAAVCVVAATCRPSALDAALRRAGRLELEIGLGALPADERLEVLRRLTAQMPLAADVDLGQLASQIRGYMAADCAGLCTDAALACLREEVDAVEASCHDGAITEDLLLHMVVKAHHFQRAVQQQPPAVLRSWTPELPDVRWEDVGGLQEVKQALQDLIQLPLRHEALVAKFGMKPSRGALLYGPPGCGKSLLAQAVARQCGANFIGVSGPELLDKWLGGSERAIRDLFTAARAASPCVVFFDEIESVAPRRASARGGCGAGDGAAARVMLQLLVEIDGFGSGAGVVILGATNRPQALDPALMRPGRLDVLLKVPLPNEAGRLQVLQAVLAKSPLGAGIDLTQLAADTEGMSGADLAELCRRAMLAAIKDLVEAEVAGCSSASTACIMAHHIARALASSRCSISTTQAAWYDSMEAALRDGSLQDPSMGAPEQQQQLVKQLVQKVTNSLAANKVADLHQCVAEQEIVVRQQADYISALEIVCKAAGLSLPKREALAL